MNGMIDRNVAENRIVSKGETIIPKGTAAVCWDRTNGYTFCMPKSEDGNDMVPEPVVFLAAIMVLGRDQEFVDSVIKRFTEKDGDHYIGEEADGSSSSDQGD